MGNLKLVKGVYYIGDPCYVLTDFQKYMGEIFMGDVIDGDGRYVSNTGLQIPVDSATIACVPVDMIAPEKLQKDFVKNNIVEFKEDFECEWYNGRFEIGEIIIETNEIINDDGYPAYQEGDEFDDEPEGYFDDEFDEDDDWEDILEKMDYCY